MADDKDNSKKKSRKDRLKEIRDLDKDGRGCGFKKDLVADRHLDDVRYERQKAAAAAAAAAGGNKGAAPVIPGITPGAPPASAAFDAIVRMEAGLARRTIAENFNDPNRPTWEDYKKAKADKLDLAGEDQRRMIEYRKQLDAERQKRLAQNRGEKDKDKKKKKKKKKDKRKKDEKKRKHKKESKKRKKKRESTSSSGSKKRKRDGSDDEENSEDEKKKEEGEDAGGAEKKEENGRDDESRSSSKGRRSGSEEERRRKKKRRRKDGSSASSSSSSGTSSDSSSSSSASDSESGGPVQLSAFLRGGGKGSDSD